MIRTIKNLFRSCWTLTLYAAIILIGWLGFQSVDSMFDVIMAGLMCLTFWYNIESATAPEHKNWTLLLTAFSASLFCIGILGSFWTAIIVLSIIGLLSPMINELFQCNFSWFYLRGATDLGLGIQTLVISTLIYKLAPWFFSTLYEILWALLFIPRAVAN